jgi:inosose dehydratase
LHINHLLTSPIMTSKLAFNPLPWMLTKEGYQPDRAPPYADMLKVIKRTGYDGLHAEIPAGMTPAAYKALLDDHGLKPAPGYHQVHLSRRSEWQATVDASKKLAAEHAAIGLAHIFLAEHFEGAPQRFTTPAEGIGFDPAVLQSICEGADKVAEAMVAEGIMPCLHPHVGTLIETVDELETLLAAVPANKLLIGPDTGHIAWTGADPVAFFHKHAARIGAIHLKDIRLDVAEKAKAAKASYFDTWGLPMWTEPGRGDVNFEGLFAAIPKFDGWFVVEVDIADQPTVEESARVSALNLRKLI